MRISPHIAPSLSGSTLSAKASTIPGQAVAERVREQLFGRVQPRQVDASVYPDLAALLRLLNRFRRKFARLLGDNEDDFEIVLADGATAAIDAKGTIYMGVAFLRAYRHTPEVLLGALAHEIGHQPKRWQKLQKATLRAITAAELTALCRHEEIRADMFAGRALAEVEMDCEPVISFLISHEIRPHPEYLPATERGEVIRKAHLSGSIRANARRKLFPNQNRHVSLKEHIGEY